MSAPPLRLTALDRPRGPPSTRLEGGLTLDPAAAQGQTGAVATAVLDLRQDEVPAAPYVRVMWVAVFAVFHGVLGLALGAALWSSSFRSWGEVMAVLFVVGLGAIWATWPLAVFVRRRRGRSPTVRWILVAPAIVLVTVALLWADVPFKLRWRMARPRFERVVALADPHLARTDDHDIEAPRHLAGYEVYVRQQGEAVIFTVVGAGFVDDEGFAYLPKGPFPELESGSFENPQFCSLGGGWYWWSASW